MYLWKKIALMKTAVEILEEIRLLPILERLVLSKLLNDMLIDYIVNISIEKDGEANRMDLLRVQFEALSKQIQPQAIPDEEIVEEIRAYRREKASA
jgi:formylmethanofuran dehydrogenase subunit B